ncbi:MAG: hypothetical protein O7G31_13710, partial [Calditrichaeota bacterium]|nr:hypothetical protein [Calditrichota bacterium]
PFSMRPSKCESSVSYLACLPIDGNRQRFSPLLAYTSSTRSSKSRASSAGSFLEALTCSLTSI